MVRWQHAFGVDGECDGGAQLLGQKDQCRRGLNRATTGQDQRTPGLGQTPAHLLDRGRGRPGARSPISAEQMLESGVLIYLRGLGVID